MCLFLLVLIGFPQHELKATLGPLSEGAVTATGGDSPLSEGAKSRFQLMLRKADKH